jgi:hypothetical protein
MTETTPNPPCPSHHIHKYTFDEVALGTGSNEQPYFRALLFFSKKPGLCDEFFHEHWKSVHADLTMQTKDTGVNLLRYTQVCYQGLHAGLHLPFANSYSLRISHSAFLNPHLLLSISQPATPTPIACSMQLPLLNS